MWHYVDNEGKTSVPMDEASFERLIANGTITPETYVWKEGQATWVPLRELRSAGSLVPPPPAFASPTPTDTAWCDGNLVVTYDRLSLPARCYKCNRPASDPPFTRQLWWHTPWLYLLIIGGLLIYAIVAIIVRERATVDIYLCSAHLKRRKFSILGAWLGVLLSLGLFIAGAAENQGWLIIGSFLVFFAAIVVGMVGSNIAQTARIQDQVVRLKGAGKAFLDSLPPLP